MLPAFVNSRAGNAAEATGVLRAVGGFDVQCIDPDDIENSVRESSEAGAQRILVAGGDGTLSRAAAALIGTSVELAILPCGTLNHVAKDLGVPLDLELAAGLALRGRAVDADVASVNGRVFLSTSSVGGYVSFVRVRERLEPTLGYHVASFIAATRLLVRLPLFAVTLAVNGKTRDYLTPLVFIGVGERELKLPTLGARVADGRAGLHVMVVRTRSSARALALGLAAAARGVKAVSETPDLDSRIPSGGANGRSEEPSLDSFLVSECRIEPHAHHIAVDGEIIAARAPLSYRYLPGRLRVVARADVAL